MKTKNIFPNGTIRNIFNSYKVYKFATGSWSSMNQRCVNGLYSSAPSLKKNKQHNSYQKKKIEIHLDRFEFYRWVEEKAEIVEKIYNEGNKPNIDRIDDNGNYILSNMQIISNIENAGKRRQKPKKLTPKEKYGAIYNLVNNRKAYINALGEENIKKGPFDEIIMNLPIKEACRVIEQSREELKTELTNQEKEGN